MEKKNKFLGFRIGYSDYMSTLQAAEQLDVSVTDFILSLLLPVINKAGVKEPEQTVSNTETVSVKPEPNVGKEVSQTQQKINEKELFEIEEKIKKYNNKLKTI